MRGISVRELSRLTTTRDGRTIVPPNGVSEIENGLRRVDIDDLIALSLALGTSPAVLLMPQPELPDDQGRGVVHLDADDEPLTTEQVWDWLTAAKPLVTDAMMDELDKHDDAALMLQERWLWWQRTLPKFARKKDNPDG